MPHRQPFLGQEGPELAWCLGIGCLDVLCFWLSWAFTGTEKLSKSQCVNMEPRAQHLNLESYFNTCNFLKNHQITCYNVLNYVTLYKTVWEKCISTRTAFCSKYVLPFHLPPGVNMWKGKKMLSKSQLTSEKHANQRGIVNRLDDGT